MATYETPEFLQWGMCDGCGQERHVMESDYGAGHLCMQCLANVDLIWDEDGGTAD